jgi:hypothetical protein
MRESYPGMLRTDSERRWKDEFVTYFEVEKGGISNIDDLYMFMWGWFKKEMMTHYQAEDSRIEDFTSIKYGQMAFKRTLSGGEPIEKSTPTSTTSAKWTGKTSERRRPK